MADDGGDERIQVEGYLKSFCIEEIMDEVLNQVVMERPKNPYLAIGALMEAKSMPEIIDVTLSSVVVSGLRCGVQASILTNVGNFSGVTCYANNAAGQTFRSYSTIIDKLKNILINLDPTNLTAFDEQVAKLEGIDPAESLALSIACCRAAARHRVIQPYDVICSLLHGPNTELMSIPVPVVSAVSRAVVSGSALQSQDITISALNASSFESALESLMNVCVALSKSELLARPLPLSTASGSPCVDSPAFPPVLRAVKAVIGELGLTSKIGVGLHYRAEKLLKQPVDGSPAYVLEVPQPDPKAKPGSEPVVVTKTGQEVVDALVALWTETEFMSLENPLSAQDVVSLKTFRKKVRETLSELKGSHSDKLKYCSAGVGGDAACGLQVLLDEQSFTPMRDEEGFINEMPFNTLKLQINNLSSLSQGIELCRKAKKFQCAVLVSVSDAANNVETVDSIAADFAVGVGAGQLSGGGLHSAEYLTTYNRVMEIVAANHKIHFAGGKFRGKA